MIIKNAREVLRERITLGISGGLVVVVLITGVVILLTGIGRKAAPTPVRTPKPTASPTATIFIMDDGFAQPELEIKVNTPVTWFNMASATVAVNSAVHPTHQLYPPLNLGPVKPGTVKTVVFDKAGTYKYHNHLKPTQTGTITVVE